MKKSLKYSIIIALLLCPKPSIAQSIPKLGQAKEISTGKLPNGIEYYVVSNPHSRGFADLGLISTPRIEDNEARKNLETLPLFDKRVPYKFFADNSVCYAREGFISQSSDATLYHFRDVPISKQEICDSSLLAIMNLAALNRTRQAVIVSGDINSAQIIEKLKILSMVAPKLNETEIDTSYKWQASNTSNIAIKLNQSKKISAVSVIFSGERLNKELMNTAQHLVSKTYTNILGEVICNRLDSVFTAQNIPIAKLEYEHHDSSLSPSDEFFVIKVTSYSSNYEEVILVLANTLASIDKKGIRKSEFEHARRQIDKQLRVTKFASNSDYIKRCKSAFLYGSDLASTSTKNDFLLKHRLPTESELPIFNDFATALLDSTRNLTLRLDSPILNIDSAAIKHCFAQNWTDEPLLISNNNAQNSSDPILKPSSESKAQLTALRTQLADAKVKLNSDNADPISGGRIWTFSNGIRVVYKRVDNTDGFQFGLMLRGGLPALNGLKMGEAAFASDMLRIGKISGMKAEDFFELLEEEGISMQSSFTMHDFRITGYADKNKLPMLLRALTIIAKTREIDESQFAQFKYKEQAKYDARSLRPIEPKPLIDSIIRPNYIYTSHKNPYRISEALAYKVDKYLNSAFSETNSGLLVLIGDLDEESAKKYLVKVIGNLQTQKASNNKYKVQSKFISNSVRKRLQARGGFMEYREKGAYIGLSAPITYNINNVYAFQLAVEYLRAELGKQLIDKGAYCIVKDYIEDYPAERMNIYIECRPCFESGLPSSINAAEPLELAKIIKSTIENLQNLQIDAEQTSMYRNKLLGYLSEQQSLTENIIDAEMTRYASGKDVYSGAKDALSKVNESKIKEIFNSIASAVSVEYVIE